VRQLLLLLASALGFGAHQAVPARAPDRPVHLTVAASGDLLIHTPVAQRALALGHGRRYEFGPMFAPVRRVIAGADVALCHMETPLVPGPVQGYPVFRTPPDLARSIRRVGWDACSTASNHSLDAGQHGIDTTLRALRRAGVKATGTARSARGRRRMTILRAKGVRIAFLSYTAVTNGQAVPHPWSLNWASPRRILRDARRARRRGARIVIVNIHWGTEFVSAPNAQQLALARRLTRSPAIDAIVGQHVHVVQPIRRVGGKPVVFGEGNLLSNQTAACCPAASQYGLIALIDFVVRPGHRARARRVRYVPTWVRHPDFTVRPAPPGSPAWRTVEREAGRPPGSG
jgi:poly-gamma-glutamate capsule biosynthesis protein CapA/YwtB (metallophosphatase superfamily)